MEFEGHPSVGVNGYRVDNDQPELFVKLGEGIQFLHLKHCLLYTSPSPRDLFVKLGEGIQFLHLKHKCSDGFCLSFPCRLCGAELFKLCLGFFILLRKTVVSGLGCLTIAPAIQRFSGSLTITAEQKDAISIKRTNPLCRIAPQRGHLCAKTAEKPYIKRFSGIEKVHRNSIKITVDFWWVFRDSNPGPTGYEPGAPTN